MGYIKYYLQNFSVKKNSKLKKLKKNFLTTIPILSFFCQLNNFSYKYFAVNSLENGFFLK